MVQWHKFMEVLQAEEISSRSWNSIMSIVEKIEELGGRVQIGEDCSIEFGGYSETFANRYNCDFETFKTEGKKLNKVYEAVIECIEWLDNNERL